MFLIKKTIQTMLLTSYYNLVQMLQASYNTDPMEDIPPGSMFVHAKLALLNMNCNEKMKAANDRKTRNRSLFEKLQKSTDG